MPTYVYRFVDTGETIEVQQAFTDDALTEATHPGTGEVMPVKKVFTPVGVTFKGGGFYKTDSRGSSSRTSSIEHVEADGVGEQPTRASRRHRRAGLVELVDGSSSSSSTLERARRAAARRLDDGDVERRLTAVASAAPTSPGSPNDREDPMNLVARAAPRRSPAAWLYWLGVVALAAGGRRSSVAARRPASTTPGERGARPRQVVVATADLAPGEPLAGHVDDP